MAGAVGAVLLGTVAFAGIGLLMAGTLRAEVNLAAANGLYLVLLLLGGMVIPLAKLPERAGRLSPSCCRPPRCPTPSTPPSARGVAVPAEAWVVLAVWAVAAPVAAALTLPLGMSAARPGGELGTARSAAPRRCRWCRLLDEDGVGITLEVEAPLVMVMLGSHATGKFTPSSRMNDFATDVLSKLSTPMTRIR